MHRFILSLTAAALVTGLIAAPPAAAQQSLSVYVGGFSPRSLDARDGSDVLFQNMFRNDGFARSFDFDHFTAATAGAEWLVALGREFEGGVGVGIYSRSTPAVLTNYENSDGSEIVSHMKLRIVPITATFRWLPFGRRASLVPYLGAGVGVFAWRYSEIGQFVDPADETNTIFNDSFGASGTNVGPVVMGGVRIPFDAIDIGAEVRYQDARGHLPGSFDFATIDLGGLNYLITLNVRF